MARSSSFGQVKIWTGKTFELETGAALAVLVRMRLGGLKERILGVALLLIRVKADLPQLFTKFFYCRNEEFQALLLINWVGCAF